MANAATHLAMEWKACEKTPMVRQIKLQKPKNNN